MAGPPPLRWTLVLALTVAFTVILGFAEGSRPHAYHLDPSLHHTKEHTVSLPNDSGLATHPPMARATPTLSEESQPTVPFTQYDIHPLPKRATQPPVATRRATTPSSDEPQETVPFTQYDLHPLPRAWS